MRARAKVSEEIPPGRRALAEVVNQLLEHLGVATLEEAAGLITSYGYLTDKSRLSRYRNGRNRPPKGFLVALHAVAVERAGSEQTIGISKHDALEALAAAETKACAVCPTLYRRIRHVRKRNRRLLRDNRRLLEARAGLEEELAELRKNMTPLPVPPQRGDRQRIARDVTAARQFAVMTAGVDEATEPEAALAVLRETAEVLTPLESAAAVALLRGEGRHELADTLITLYGRDHPHKEVILAALQLHDYGMADDAGAMLRAAAG
ncbi:hypothetical protein ABZ547_27015 [Streptomyces sparsogenes]|uniref:hypothetical protein n=1 Tax=Streptomyces sparsogenes TaxID=67365 RepID=UPI0033FCCB25